SPAKPKRKEETLPARPAETRPQQGSASETARRNELAGLAERMRNADAFVVLDVPRNASDDQIRTAYADLAKRTHPDRFVTATSVVHRLAEEVFGLVSAAYEAIGEPTNRVKYLRGEADRKKLEEEIQHGQRAVRAELDFQKGEAALRARKPEL